jgi:glutathione S-transferase
MLQVLGRSSSINVRKVLWTCHELGLAFDHVEWGSAGLDLSSPQFRRLNPNGLIPVLVDGPLVLWESNAICRYLAARERDTRLLPDAPAARAVVEQWMDWQATELNNAWRYAFMALVRKSPRHTDPAAVQESVASWNRHMTILDGALAQSGAYVTGNDLTLADVVLGLCTHRWYATPFDKPALTAVARFYEVLHAREGFVRYGDNGQP